MLLLTILVFIICLSLIVLVHELGHYIFAVRNGVKVEEFGIGYAPMAGGFYKNDKGKIRWFWGKNYKKRSDYKGTTIYTINYIPFGGFVRMLGEETGVKSKDSFSEKSPWSRFKIIVAGVFFNFLLAWILFTIWYWVVPANLPNNVVVVSVNENSAADKAGIKSNDLILKISGVDVKNVEELRTETLKHLGQDIKVVVNHNGKDQEVSVSLPKESDVPLGVSLSETGGTIEKGPWWRAPYNALLEMVAIVWMSLTYLFDLISAIFTSKTADTSAVSGPVGVFSMLRQVINYGFSYIIRFTAVLSVGVGFLNIMPFPALDGGHMLFIILESIFGKKVLKKEVENGLHWTGFLLLLALFVLVTYKDIVKLIIK